ncbi:MAG: hypothetical protein HZB43_08360 [candidate division Zixibacteria bacterium]|nr:hypothetical protein [candidate division Zixibacteria bacterium]
MPMILLATTLTSPAADMSMIADGRRRAQFLAPYPRTQVKFHKNGTPSWIHGDLSGDFPEDPPLDVFYIFMETNKGWFGLSDLSTELRLERCAGPEGQPGPWHLYFQQMYNGLEVYTGGIGANFNRKGILESVSAGIHPNIDLPATPTVSEEEAKRIVTRDVASSDSLDLSRCRLIVYPWNDTCHLAWQIVSIPGGRYEVDALTGNIISWDPRGAYPKVRIIEPGPPGPAGIIPPAVGSPPGTAIKVITRPINDSVSRMSRPVTRGTAVLPPDLPKVPADTNPKKKSDHPDSPPPAHPLTPAPAPP